MPPLLPPSTPVVLWVDTNPYLLRKAAATWSGSGRPTIDDFTEGPLEAAVFFCERGYDVLPLESPGSPIKLVVLPPTGLFPVIVFYAMEVLGPDPARRFVELLDYTIDDSPAEEAPR